jgi:hypothetical protein
MNKSRLSDVSRGKHLAPRFHHHQQQRRVLRKLRGYSLPFSTVPQPLGEKGECHEQLMI